MLISVVAAVVIPAVTLMLMSGDEAAKESPRKKKKSKNKKTGSPLKQVETRTITIESKQSIDTEERTGLLSEQLSSMHLESCDQDIVKAKGQDVQHLTEKKDGGTSHVLLGGTIKPRSRRSGKLTLRNVGSASFTTQSVSYAAKVSGTSNVGHVEGASCMLDRESTTVDTQNLESKYLKEGAKPKVRAGQTVEQSVSYAKKASTGIPIVKKDVKEGGGGEEC
ncbi:hypothetical protein [Ehrlichia chaffeensis]|uniref:hypothetical protein n=1 Tax=Ehrlichia chaffeensis TaxID=945 RepID=UPI000B24B8B3|nr:hypothetical protein [Ehrlichia chaffeensis]